MKGLFAAPFVRMDVQGPLFKGQLDFLEGSMLIDLQQIIEGAHHGSPSRPSVGTPMNVQRFKKPSDKVVTIVKNM